MEGRFYYKSMKTGGLVAFFDSGIGGLPYLQWLRDNHARVRCSYLADRRNFPYGEKSPGELVDLILDAMDRYLQRVHPDLVVVACNTASVTALQALRESFDLPFVGVVPAIKPAASLTKSGEIGLLATKRTVEDPYTDNLVRLFAGSHRVRRFAGVDIIDFVENHFLTASSEDIEEVLKPAAEWFSQTEIDTLVLGCTHFLHLRREISRIWGEEITLVDSLEGVGRQIIRLLEAIPGTDAEQQETFFITGPLEAEEIYHRFARAFNLSWGGYL